MTLLRNNLTLSPDNMPLSANKGRLFVRKINSIGEGLLILLMEDYYSYGGSDTIAKQVGMGDNGGLFRSELTACLHLQAERRCYIIGWGK